ncbi:hypothetical protein [Flavobacterium alkalisoli]|uniref:hypothetical protein n=1 Tax=Flavobacterium alkalisoli TaxID=2602769 RepID=UPI003A8FBC2B
MKNQSFQEVLGQLSGMQRGNGVAVIGINGINKKVRRRILYAAGITGSSDITSDGQFIQASTNPEIGRTNIDKGNQLNDGRSFIVTGVRMLFDTTTASVTKLTATYKDEAPIAYKNGELKINQDGSGDLFLNPISAFVKNNGALSSDEEFSPVVPFLLRSGTPFTIQALTAGSATAGQAVRIEIDGYELVDADRA